MINWDKINKKISVKKVILPLLVVILILLLCFYIILIRKYISKSVFAADMEEIITKNENPQFSISQIYLCSSANAIDSSENQNLGKLDLYQYTDIAIYLNNHSNDNLNNKNTIKSLYINDFSVELENSAGQAGIVYLNTMKIGKREELKNIITSNQNINTDRIDFRILKTNEENNTANYDEPVFCADCSNPITLKYINKINKEYVMAKNETTSFNGTILKKAGVSMEDINAKISFRINIINNEDEQYSALVNFKIPLDDLFDKGTTIKSRTLSGREYDFITI